MAEIDKEEDNEKEDKGFFDRMKDAAKVILPGGKVIIEGAEEAAERVRGKKDKDKEEEKVAKPGTPPRSGSGSPTHAPDRSAAEEAEAERRRQDRIEEARERQDAVRAEKMEERKEELAERERELEAREAKMKEEELEKREAEVRERMESQRAKAESDSAAKAQAAEEAQSEAAAAEPRTYTVQPGDSLSKIALALYGDARRWPDILEANRDKIKNPDLIHPGQVFVIPD